MSTMPKTGMAAVQAMAPPGVLDVTTARSRVVAAAGGAGSCTAGRLLDMSGVGRALEPLDTVPRWLSGLVLQVCQGHNTACQGCRQLDAKLREGMVETNEV